VATANDTAAGITVIGQAVAVSENDPTVAGFDSYTDTLTSGVVKISNQLLQDSEFDLDSWIQSTFGTRYYRGLRSDDCAGQQQQHRGTRLYVGCDLCQRHCHRIPRPGDAARFA
jgi:hypothetical protein